MPSVTANADAMRIESSGVEVEMLRAVGTIPGVAPLAAAGLNGPGSGRLTSSGDGTAIAWRAPGSATYGELIPVGNGDYLLEDGETVDKWLRVRVTSSYLFDGPTEAAVELGEVFNNAIGHSDLSAAQAAANTVQTWTVDLVNDGPADVLDVRVWLDNTAEGFTDLEISDDGATWVQPDSETHGSVLIWPRIVTGGSTLLYFRRTNGTSSGHDTDVLHLIELAWDGL